VRGEQVNKEKRRMKKGNREQLAVEKSEIIMYQPDETVAVEVRLENENVWLNRQQISVLFDRDIKTIGKHINNALNEELAEFSTAADGKVYQMEYYNLDVILSVGYRVKSSRGIQFRVWANSVLKLQLDITRHNSQYEPINIKTSNVFHDRFLIIDNVVYHIGASLKDLGKKLFAFSKMEIKYTELLMVINTP